MTNIGTVLGELVEHKDLGWGSFPGSHNFYRARDAPEYDTYIAIPQSQAPNEHGKRGREAEEETRSVRLKQFQPHCEDAPESSEAE